MDELTLYNYFSGALSPEEALSVEVWMAASPQNQQMAKDIYYLQFATDALNIKKSSQTTRVLQHIKQSKKRSRSISRTLERVAAVLFIPLLLGVLAYQLKKDPVYYMEARASTGISASVDLPDGSKVWLNSNSSLKYPTSFTGDTRTVYLEGEAYFSVEKGKKRFVVEAGDVQAEVFGTEFNMDAYPSSGFVSTTLVEGAVTLHCKGEDNNTLKYVMHPNQEMVYTQNNHKLGETNAYLPTNIAWKEGKIILKATPIEDVLWILSKKYNVAFIIENEAYHDYSFTGIFTDQSINTVLDHFTAASNIKYRIENATFSYNGEMNRTQITLF